MREFMKKIEQERETGLNQTVENVTMNKNIFCYCILTLEYVKRHCVVGYLLVNNYNIMIVFQR